MPKLNIAAVACIVCVGAFFTAPASAEIISRLDTISAAGACVPFAPTSQIRYSAAALRNAGSQTFYVACGTQGPREPSDDGAYLVYVFVANTSDSPKQINCTLRPGYSGAAGSTNTLQGAYPQSITLPAGGDGSMSWLAESYTENSARFQAPNFTCTVPGGAEIRYLQIERVEDIGTP